MALAFKRAQAESEKAIEGTNKSIAEWYKGPVNPAVVIDYESAKAVEGVSTQNPNKAEGPKSITIVNWVKDNYNRMHSIWGDVKSKDDKNLVGVKIMHQHIEKAIFHFDDKANGKKYNSYDVEMKGKELHITVHFDFENYPQSLNLADEKNGKNIKDFVWEYLNDTANVEFQIKKTHLQQYEHSALKSAVKTIKEKSGKEVPITIDFDAIEKFTGKSVYYSNKPPLPNNFLALNFLDDGKGLNSIAYGVAELCKDKMGKEAFAESFDNIVVHVEAGSSQPRAGPHEFKKDGKTIHYTFKVNFAVTANNWGSSSSEIGKQLESLL